MERKNNLHHIHTHIEGIKKWQQLQYQCLMCFFQTFFLKVFQSQSFYTKKGYLMVDSSVQLILCGHSVSRVTAAHTRSAHLQCVVRLARNKMASSSPPIGRFLRMREESSTLISVSCKLTWMYFSMFLGEILWK